MDHNRLEPGTTYYYRISVVDRWNNEGALSETMAVTTLAPGEKNMVPLRVEGLRAILVSPSAHRISSTSCFAPVANRTFTATTFIVRPEPVSSRMTPPALDSPMRTASSKGPAFTATWLKSIAGAIMTT